MYTIDQLNGDLVMDRGDYVDPKLTITDADGNPLNVSAATFKLTVKASLDDPLASATFQIVSPGGFDLTQAASGIVVPIILETYTQGLAGDFYWDVEMVLAGKTRTLVSAALFQVRKEVTDTGASPPAPSVGVPFPSWIQVIGGEIYIKDLGVGVDAGKYWKMRMLDGELDFSGPSTVVPF